MDDATLDLLGHLITADGGMAQSRAFHRGSILRIVHRRYVSTAYWNSLGPDDRYRLTTLAALQTRPDATLMGPTSLYMGLSGVPTLRPQEVWLNTSRRQSVGTRSGGFRVEGTDEASRIARSLPAPALRFCLREVPAPVVSGHLRLEPLLSALAAMLLSTHSKEALCAADAAARMLKIADLSTHDGLLDLIGHSASASARQRALGLARMADPLSESVGESFSRFVILDAGFPRPVLQHSFFDERGFIGRPDYWWPEFHLIGEFDGMEKYSNPEYGDRGPGQRIRAEKERDGRLTRSEGQPLHWVWADQDQPGRLVGLLSARGLSIDRTQRPWP